MRKPDADAQLVAESVALQLEKRMSFRRVMKQAIGKAMRSGVKGVKMMVSGRLDGAEIARCEQYHEGSIPLQDAPRRHRLWGLPRRTPPSA